MNSGRELLCEIRPVALRCLQVAGHSFAITGVSAALTDILDGERKSSINGNSNSNVGPFLASMPPLCKNDQPCLGLNQSPCVEHTQCWSRFRWLTMTIL
jgi:hypothetical protein